jgi:hypothetical protein
MAEADRFRWLPGGTGLEEPAVQLYNWRLAWKAVALVARASPTPAEFVQLGVVADASGQSPAMPGARGAPAGHWRSAPG